MNGTENQGRIHDNLINFERAILSSILYNPETIIDVADRLKPHQFYLHNHGEIYSAMLSLQKKDLPIDESFLDQETKGKCQKELSEIMIVNPIANIYPYVTEVVEQFRTRQMRALAMQIIQSHGEEKRSDTIISEIEAFISDLDEGEEDIGKSFTQLKEEYEKLPPSPIFDTGVSFVNEGLNGGFEMGQFVLMSGDPEAGKTILTLQILKNVSNYAPAVMFAFEFTTRSLVKMQLKTEGKDYTNDNLIIIDKGYDIGDIERKVKKWKRKGARFFVIDSQMRIENASSKGITMEERETEKFSRLAKLAHSQDILIILIIQNSKADASAGTIQPMGSKKGAHEASIIMHLKRLKDDPEKGIKEQREFVLNKNKQTGQHFVKKINFNPYTLQFTRPYGEGESVEYEGHKKPIPVEHQDKNGKTTAKSHMSVVKESLMDDGENDQLDMAVL